MWRDKYSQGRYGQGEFTVSLPAKPTSCTLEGTWTTNNQMWASLGRPKLHCHNAQGTFSAAVDRLGQRSLNNPGHFRWAGGTEPAYDPPSYEKDNYVMEALLCDHLYYTPKGKRYSAKLWVEKFAQDMQFKWEYFEDATQPGVDVFFDLSCDLRSSAPPSARVSLPARREEIAPEEIPPDTLAFAVDVEELEPSVVPVQSSTWQRFTSWLTNIFF